MDILAIIKQASKLLWANKVLWFFGFFVAGFGGAGGGNPKHDGATSSVSGGIPTWLWPFIVGGAIAGLAMLLLHVVSEAALIEGVKRRGADESYGLRTGLSVGLRHFWRVLSVKLLAFAVVIAGAALVAAPVLLAVFKALPLWAGIPLTALLAMAGVPLLLTGYFLYEDALRFAVLEGAPATEAFRAARAFLHGRLVSSIWLLVTSSASSMAAGFATFLVAIPGALIGLGVYFTAGLVPAIVTGLVLFVPLAFPILGALGAFQSAVWTLGFLGARRAA
jgi:hypothetical protein